MFSAIRSKLIFSHLVVVGLAMLLLAFLLQTLLVQYFLEATQNSLVVQAQITAQVMIPGGLVETPPDSIQAPVTNAIQQQQSANLVLQAENLSLPPGESAPGGVSLGYLSDASLQLGTQLTTRIRILDAAGTVVFDSVMTGEDSLLGYNLAGETLVAGALAGRAASRTYAAQNTPMMDFVLPVEADGLLLGLVLLSQPLDDVTAVLDDVRYRLLISTVFAALASGLIGLALAQAITRPIRHLTRAAQAVALGNLDQAVSIHSRDELGVLIRTFNTMTARLRAARQMQIDFVANVSHELRTPLTSIKGMVETLRGGAVEDASVRDGFLATLEDETNRLIRLVNDLLLLSRLDSEAMTLRREAVNLPALVRETLDRFQARSAHRFVIEPRPGEGGPGAGPAVWGDRDRIAQVLVNLLDNAVKYSPPDSRITVMIGDGPNPGECLVQVRDAGIGIPAQDIDRIGERFYRADKARSRGGGGSGLGLAIARSLVQAQGGRLWLESEEGAGTCVSFTLVTR